MKLKKHIAYGLLLSLSLGVAMPLTARKAVAPSSQKKYLDEQRSLSFTKVKKAVIVTGFTLTGIIIGFAVGNTTFIIPPMKYDADGTPNWTPAIINCVCFTAGGGILGSITGTKIADYLYKK